MTSRSIPRALALLSFSALFAVACGDGNDQDPTDTGVPSSGNMDAEGPDGGDAGFPDAMRADARVDAGRRDLGVEPDSGIYDDDNDFEHATSITLNEQNGLDGVIDPEGDLDYVSINLPGEGWYIFDIQAPNGSTLDSVITLYNSEHTQVAQNDDEIFGGTLESEIVYHAAAPGEYFVKIEDYSTFRDPPAPEGGPDKTYIFRVFNNFNPALVNVETESGDDPASAAVLMTNMGFAYVLGTYRDADDVDLYQFTVPAGDTQQRYDIDLMPTGPTGYGSSETGLVSLSDTTGATITARLDFSGGDIDLIQPSVAPNSTFLLQVKHPAAAAGTNEFYVIKMNPADENPVKVGEPGNNTLMGAETVALAATNNPMIRAGFFSGTIDDGDVDYFQVSVNQGESFDVACGSAYSGSGIINLQLEVLTSTGGVIATSHEMLPAMPAVASVTSTGTLYLKLSKEAQDPEVVGNWVRCGARASM